MQLGEDDKLPFNAGTIVFAIGTGLLSALLGVSLISGSPLALLLAYLAPFPLFLCGLGRGAKAAFVAGMTGIIGSVLLAGPLAGSAYAVMTAFPAWLGIRLALTSRNIDGDEDWFPSGTILVTLVGYACVVFVLGLAAFGQSNQGIEAGVETFLQTVMQNIAFVLAPDDQQLIIEQLASFFPAMILISWTLLNIVNMTLAQSVLRKSGKALRPTPRYSEITLPDFASFVFIGLAAVTVLSSGDMAYVARNLTLVSAVPFFFLGLVLVHKLAAKTKMKGVLLSVYYLMLFVSTWVALPTIGLGLYEQWIGLRQKLAAQPDLQERD